MAYLPSRQERILVFGGAKTGKTYDWLSIAQFAHKTNSPSHFWVIDNDNQVEASGLGEHGSLAHLLERSTVWVPENFDEYKDITEEIRGRAKREDWIIIDMISNVWEHMPSWWMDKVYGEDEWSYWVSVRKEILQAEEQNRGSGKEFGGTAGVDWQFIGRAYRGWEKQLTLFSPCHVFAVSGETEIQERFDKSGEQRAKYAITNGFAPKTEKGVSHRFHTIMRQMKTVGRGGKEVRTRELTVVGDRDREGKWGEKFGKSMTMELGMVEDLAEAPVPKLGFAFDYLCKIGGWKPSGG